jgi:subtilisin family serine protease
VVRFHEDAVRPHVRSARPSAAEAAAVPTELVSALRAARERAGAPGAEPLFAPAPAGTRGAPASPEDRDRMAVLASVAQPPDPALAGYVVLSLPQGAAGSLLADMQAHPAVSLVEPAPERWLLAEGPDPMRGQQWGLDAIHWPDADRPDAHAVTVAVLDTGVDQGHPDLAGVVTGYEHEGRGESDPVGHGTHVSGIVAAVTGNAVGISGVAAVSLHVWKIFPDTPEDGENFYVDGPTYLRALAAVQTSGARSLNLSIGGTSSSQTEQLLFDRLRAAGVTACAAMGNEFQEGNPTEYPGAYDTVVSVGAVAEDGTRAEFSNTGPHIDLSAPGVNILSTLPRDASQWRRETEYASWSGTSMATPHVAAAAALIAARHPDWGPDQVSERLRTTAAKLSGMGGADFTDELGAGLLDLRAALA